MDFGKVDDIDKVDISLPEDHPDTIKLLKSLKKKKKTPKVYIGAAKWGRKEWVGKIYPPKTKDKDFLTHYLEQFDSIELNATHYQMPTPESIKKWKTNAGKDFKFCPKFPQIISHMKRLKNCEDQTKRFYDAIRSFENNLGICFLQLPPNYPPKNFTDLEKYIKTLPGDVEICVELRHPDWFKNSDIANETFIMFKENNVGTVITDTPGRRDAVHQRLTTPSPYIRFVGNNLHSTDYTRVDDWVERIKYWLESGAPTIYFMMHQVEEEYTPELTNYAIKQINKRCKLDLKELVFYNGEQK